MKLKKYSILLIIFICFSLLLKVDFRLQDDISCCSDDFDYFIHAETISEDFDFDYTNQLGIYEEARYFREKAAPIGFPGSGILAVPFMLLGIWIDRLLFYFFDFELQITNFKLYFYSLSSIFYLLTSVALLNKSLKIFKIKFNPNYLLLYFLGSGVSYFAFERYSMTHAYEVFSVSLLIYLSGKYFSNEKINNVFIILLAFTSVFGFYIKWVYFYIFFVPLIVKKLFFKDINRKLYTSPSYLISTLFFLFICLVLSEKIYGEFTLNPANIYGTNLVSIAVSNTSTNFFYLFDLLKNFIIILFTQEFGILWFQPIVFASTLIVIYNFLKDVINRKFNLLNFILLLSFAQVYVIQAMWESSGSSYGLRYIINLTPIAIIVFYGFKEKLNLQFLSKVLVFLSIFSFLSTIFFETTPGTQLSLDETLNSFGVYSRYSQKDYLSGYLQSFFSFDAYLKIFITSFLGLFAVKSILTINNIDEINSIFSRLGLPVDNEKFQILMKTAEEISIIYFIFVASSILFFVYIIYRYILEKNKIL